MSRTRAMTLNVCATPTSFKIGPTDSISTWTSGVFPDDGEASSAPPGIPTNTQQNAMANIHLCLYTLISLTPLSQTLKI